MLNKLKKENKGIGLIEVLAAVSISVIVITAIVSLSLYTLRSSINSRLLLEGTKFANTEMELVRAFRDMMTSWSDFSDLMITRCGVDVVGLDGCSIDVTELTQYNIDNTYYDQIVRSSPENFTITLPNDVTSVQVGFKAEEITPGIIRVYVDATWEGGQIQNTTLQSDFSNWRNRQ